MKWHINKWGQIAPITEDVQNPGRIVPKWIPVAILIAIILIITAKIYRYVVT